MLETFWWVVGVVRSSYFRQDQHGAIGVVVESAPEDVYRELVGNQHYERADKFSYFYEGELYNVRRSEGFEEIDGEEKHMEHHIRIFDHPDGAFLQSHYEQDRFTHTRGHVHGVGLSWVRGQELTVSVLEESGITAGVREAAPLWRDT